MDSSNSPKLLALQRSSIILALHYNIQISKYLHEVAKSLGGATGRGEDILNASELQHLLGHARGDDAGTPGGGHHAHCDGAALAGDLARHGVRLADLVPPVAPPDGHDRELGEDDGAADGGGHLLGALDPEPDVAVAVADDDEGLEARALPGARLLLHRRDLHDLVLEPGEEGLHDLVLLDGERVEVDLLHLLDPALLDEAPELGHGHPLLLLLLAPAAPAAPAPAAVAAPAAPEPAAEAAALAAALASAVRHGWVGWGVGSRRGNRAGYDVLGSAGGGGEGLGGKRRGGWRRFIYSVAPETMGLGFGEWGVGLGPGSGLGCAVWWAETYGLGPKGPEESKLVGPWIVGCWVYVRRVKPTW